MYVQHIFFIQSSVDGHLDCFYVLGIVNRAVMNTGMHVSFKIRVFSIFLEVLRKRKHVGQYKMLKGRQDSLLYLQAFGPGQSSPSVMRYQLFKANIFVYLVLCLKGGYIFKCNLYFIEAGWEWSSGHLSNLPTAHWVTYRNHVPFLPDSSTMKWKYQTRCCLCIVKICYSAALESDSSTGQA